MANKTTFAGLRKFNLIMAGLHAAQGVAILLISRDFSLPISGNYLTFNQSSQQLEPASTTLFRLSVPLLLTIFFGLSALAHLAVATLYRRQYETGLSKGINRARWIEYALSASTMMVAIALLVGVYDAPSLAMIFVLTTIMNLMGLVMETHNLGKTKLNWLSYWIGCLAGIVPWAVIAFYFWLSANQGSRAPTFVYWIFVSIFIFFNCFALNMVLQYKKIGAWKDYLYGERAYVVLSLVAKSLLAWQVFGGTLRP